MDNTLVIVVAAAVAVFLFFKFKNEGAWAEQLGAGPRPGGANGSPQDANALEHAIGAAAGAGVCAGGAAALGAPQVGGALAPACAALGSFVAPYVKEGAVYAAKETAAGATFVAQKVYQGAKIATNTGQTILSDPFAAVRVPTQAVTKVATVASDVGGRAIGALWSKAPAPVKVATAPLYFASKTITTGVKAAAPIVNTLASGTKAATSAVTSTTNKVLGYLGL